MEQHFKYILPIAGKIVVSSSILVFCSIAKSNERPVASKILESVDQRLPMDSTEQQYQSIFKQRLRPLVSKKIKTGSEELAPVHFVIDLEKQKTSLHYVTTRRLETDLALHHMKNNLTLSFEYRW